MKDILGAALTDYFNGKRENKLFIHNKYGEPEEMPISYYFRTEDNMPVTEHLAIENCRGRVLDIGAGTGVHSLILKEAHEVTSLEISNSLCELMKKRNVSNILCSDIYQYSDQKYDTLLLLMNGLGIAGNLDGLEKLFMHIKQLLNKGGKVLFESSDISYLNQKRENLGNRYLGEVDYRYEYNGVIGDWFTWLYADEEAVRQIGQKCGYNLEVIYEDEDGHFLGELTVKE